MPEQNGVKVSWLIRFVGCCFALVSYTNFAYTQDGPAYAFRSITRDDGLNHDEVYDITQDGRGFIWVLTRNGLQRYDGTRFINLNNVSKRPSHFTDVNDDIKLYQNKERLWINGKSFFSTIDATKFSSTNYPAEELFADSSAKYQTYFDQHGIQGKLGNDFYFVYDSIDKQFHPVLFVPDAAVAGQSNFFVTDTINHLTWLASNATGLMVFDSATSRAYSVGYNPLNNKILRAFEGKFGNADYGVNRVMRDFNGDLWISSFEDEFYRFDARDNRLIIYSITSILNQNHKSQDKEIERANITAFLRDSHGNLWVTTENAGLLKFIASENRFQIVAVANNIDHQLPNKLYTIFQDDQDNIWLGTNNGIMIFNPYHEPFKTIRHDVVNERSLAKGEIADYIQTKAGNILVGTWGGGISVYDSNWNFKENIVFKTDNNQNLIWCFAEAEDGKIWIGAQHGYVHIYDPLTKNVKTIHPAQLQNSTVRCITKDRHGDMWFGLHSGIVVSWNMNDQLLSIHDNYPGPTDQRSSVTNIFFDQHDKCWIGTEKSFGLLDTRRALDDMQPGNSKAFIQGSIQAIEHLNDSTLLVGTINDGIKLFNIINQTFSSINFVNLPSPQNVYAIRVDHEGSIWFTSDYSIYKFDSQQSLRTFTIDRQTIHATFDSKSFYQLRNGEWITSTSAEIFRFNPDSIDLVTEHKIPIRITSLQIFDSTLVVDSLTDHNLPLHLTYKDNFLNIQWSKPEFFTSMQDQFYYRLIGIDDQWINSKGLFNASYTNLPPGGYTFEVKAGEGKTPEDFAMLVIIIDPPFWRTRWFVALSIIFFSVVIYTIVKWRVKILNTIRNEKSEAQKSKIDMLSLNEKLSIAKLDALRSQMNPHFIFNCLTSIDNLIQSGDKEEATTYLAKFAKLMRSVLETSQMTTVQCWKDMETLKMYIEMEALRWDQKFAYSLDVSNEILTGDYKVPPLIIQPFVENAIHHGLLSKKESDRDLNIKVWASQTHIHYIISDNGIGRLKATEYRELNRPDHRSMGIQISIDRIKLLNQGDDNAVVITDLYNDNKQPIGTQVEVNILNR